MPQHTPLRPPHLRPAQVTDVPEILRIQAACYNAIVPEDAAAYLNKLHQAPDCAFVLQSAPGQLVAYLFALPIAVDAPPALNSNNYLRSTAANCLYLHDLAIDPAAHGLGLSQPLMAAFFQTARQQNLHFCSLIAIQNSDAFWQRYGFRTDARTTTPAIQEQLRSYGPACYLLCPCPST